MEFGEGGGDVVEVNILGIDFTEEELLGLSGFHLKI